MPPEFRSIAEDEVKAINEPLVEWVREVAAKTKPKEIVWCDGSDRENRSLIAGMLEDGTLLELNGEEYPNSFLHRSNPNDVARTEASTFVCTTNRDDVGPTNNWMRTTEAEDTLWKVFDGCMEGRTMFVVPYLLGPGSSPFSQVGVEITDSPYVVVSLRIMTRMGRLALERLKGSSGFVRGIHSRGTMDPKLRYICHFPQKKLIMSINSEYGGNALLSKKCHSLRIASVVARDEGWLAEHMLIVGIEDGSGEVTYLTGAFPSASGKTNLAMLKPPPSFSEFKVWTLGDDIAWLHLDSGGALRAMNPEAGFFCVARNSSAVTNPNLIETIHRNTIFTNVALSGNRTPWWEGEPDAGPLHDWQGRPWKPELGPAAHPNSRFTTPISQYPFLSPRFDDPNGVPVSAMVFGGRRAKLVPLVYETFGWEHGVLVGSMMKVETTAAAEGEVGKLRNDPMAMLPFCGYNMADYIRHWLGFARTGTNLPKIFHVNWFRTDDNGKFLWPGYRENIRVLKWIVDRVHGRADAVETPIGYVPAPGSLDLKGLDLAEDTIEELLRVDRQGWLAELSSSKEFFGTFGDRFPKALWEEYRKMMDRLMA